MKPEHRELVKRYLAGEPLTPREHILLSKIRRKAREELDQAFEDLKLLRRLLETRRSRSRC